MTPAVAATPAWTPSPRELDDVELLLLGALRPLSGFLGRADLESVAAHGRLRDGTLWSLPVSLAVPEDIGVPARAAGVLDLHDEEGTPVATVRVRDIWSLPNGRSGVEGKVLPLRPMERGSCHSAYRRVEAVRPLPHQAADRVLAVPLRSPLLIPGAEAVRTLARELEAEVLLLPLVGDGAPRGVDAAGLLRATREVASALGTCKLRVDVLPLPLADHGCPVALEDTAVGIAGLYGATHVVAEGGETRDSRPRRVRLPEVVFDKRSGRWAPAELVPVERWGATAADVERQVRDALRTGVPLPPDTAEVMTEREMRRGARARRGVVVMFTGLSGSGKSTLARALATALGMHDDRTTTLLDGDVVRRLLSAGLSFSRQDRDLNVRRIGFVAAQVASHGGVAICAPIAPFAATRSEVRAMVESRGSRFVLVHVSTPLSVCEQRDRKGLYAAARRGQIPQFTGVSDPYEAPLDAAAAINTNTCSVDEAVDLLVDLVLGSDSSPSRPA